MSNRNTIYSALIDITRLRRPIGIMLLLWPVLWSIVLVHQQRTSATLTLLFALGVLLMRSAGCIVNDYADRHIDGAVARTANRPLVTGALSPRVALMVFAVLILLAVGILAVILLYAVAPLKTLIFACLSLCLAIFYPFCKRYTHWPQAVLGVAFGMGVPMVFAAFIGHMPLSAWLLFGTAILWPIAYDTCYAMADLAEDKIAGVKSTAVLLGARAPAFVVMIQFLCLALLLILGWVRGWHAYYGLGVLSLVALSVHQYYLIRDFQADRCFAAFLHNNWSGAVVLLSIGFIG